jgi:hypothetical protein
MIVMFDTFSRVPQTLTPSQNERKQKWLAHPKVRPNHLTFRQAWWFRECDRQMNISPPTWPDNGI